MEIILLKKKYFSGHLKKDQYIKKMHMIHRKLFDYSTFIKNTDINKIEIIDDKVIMISRQNKIKMLCDKDDQRIAPIEILNFNNYEGDFFNFFFKLAKDVKTIFDIGANIGWQCLSVAKVFPDIKLYAFEPIPKTFAYLKENIKLNNISNITAYNFGFSDSSKKQFFYFYKEGSGNASLRNLSRRKNQNKIVCRLETVDDFVKKNGIKLDMIKCDVEGAEFFVFKGAINTLKKDKPIIFSEMLRKWSAAFKYNPNQIINFFRDLDYTCYYLVNKKLKKIEKMTKKTTETNFIFLHDKNHFSLIKKFS